MRTIYILMVMALASAAVIAGVTGPSQAEASIDTPAAETIQTAHIPHTL